MRNPSQPSDYATVIPNSHRASGPLGPFLNIALGTIAQQRRDWRRRYPDFPAPVVTFKAGLVWAWPDIEKWAKATGQTVQSG